MTISKKTIIFLDPSGIQHFPVGPTFSRGGGVQWLIPIEAHPPTPVPSLDHHWLDHLAYTFFEPVQKVNIALTKF